MDERTELELAIRSERHAALAADGLPFPIATVIDNDTGALVFPIEPAVFEAHESVLWLPEERHDAMQILVQLEEIDAQIHPTADRWRIYHGSPNQTRWASATLQSVRFGSMVASGEDLDLVNPLAGGEPALCKKYNADRALLGRAAHAMDPRSTGEGLLVGVDPMGFDIRTRFDIVRVPFGQRVTDPAKADQRVGALLAELAAAG